MECRAFRLRGRPCKLPRWRAGGPCGGGEGEHRLSPLLLPEQACPTPTPLRSWPWRQGESQGKPSAFAHTPDTTPRRHTPTDTTRQMHVCPSTHCGPSVKSAYTCMHTHVCVFSSNTSAPHVAHVPNRNLCTSTHNKGKGAAGKSGVLLSSLHPSFAVKPCRSYLPLWASVSISKMGVSSHHPTPCQLTVTLPSPLNLQVFPEHLLYMGCLKPYKARI